MLSADKGVWERCWKDAVENLKARRTELPPLPAPVETLDRRSALISPGGLIYRCDGDIYDAEFLQAAKDIGLDHCYHDMFCAYFFQSSCDIRVYNGWARWVFAYTRYYVQTLQISPGQRRAVDAFIVTADLPVTHIRGIGRYGEQKDL